MGKFIQDILTFTINALNWIINLISEKDFYIPLIAVLFAWLLAFIPQKRQHIQHTFFELLKNQINLLSRIDNNGRRGADYFQHAKEYLIYLYDFLTKGDIIVVDGTVRVQLPDSSYTTDENMIKFFRERPIKGNSQTYIRSQRELAEYIYVYFFEKNLIYVGHYFRHLFNIIKYVHKNRFWISPKFYTGLIQAQMSTPELFVFFYNGLKFKKVEYFINKYNLIENLSAQDLMKIEHFTFYKCKMKNRTMYSWSSKNKYTKNK